MKESHTNTFTNKPTSALLSLSKRDQNTKTKDIVSENDKKSLQPNIYDFIVNFMRIIGGAVMLIMLIIYFINYQYFNGIIYGHGTVQDHTNSQDFGFTEDDTTVDRDLGENCCKQKKVKTTIKFNGQEIREYENSAEEKEAKLKQQQSNKLGKAEAKYSSHRSYNWDTKANNFKCGEGKIPWTGQTSISHRGCIKIVLAANCSNQYFHFKNIKTTTKGIKVGDCGCVENSLDCSNRENLHWVKGIQVITFS